ncbi:MAG: hypothetical protein FWG63_09945 [Defluviitaleaceae bacterium]|nr:hypothetical protein [Defluviitaleaceae bacterium]
MQLEPALPDSNQSGQGNKGDKELYQTIAQLSHSTKNIEQELRQMHKLYHHEFQKMLAGMEKELKDYRDARAGLIFDSILGDISKLYADNMDLLENDPSGNIASLFDDMLSILEGYGVNMHKSKEGDARDLYCTQIRQKVDTAEKPKHGLVAASHGIALSKEKRAFVKERVDIYFYKEPAQPNPEPTPAELEPMELEPAVLEPAEPAPPKQEPTEPEPTEPEPAEQEQEEN